MSFPPPRSRIEEHIQEIAAQLLSKLSDLIAAVEVLTETNDVVEAQLAALQVTASSLDSRLTSMNGTLSTISSRVNTTNAKLSGGLPAALSPAGNLKVTGLL